MSLLSRSMWAKPSALQSKADLDPFSLAGCLWSCGSMKTVLPTSCQRCKCYPLMASSSASPRPSSVSPQSSSTKVMKRRLELPQFFQQMRSSTLKSRDVGSAIFCSVIRSEVPPIQASCCPSPLCIILPPRELGKTTHVVRCVLVVGNDADKYVSEYLCADRCCKRTASCSWVF